MIGDALNGNINLIICKSISRFARNTVDTLQYVRKLKDKKIAIYTTGITPIDCRDYYDKLVIEKNFKQGVPDCVKIFNFTGKMVIDELSVVHKTALKTLKKIMTAKKDPSPMEKLLIELCDADGDFSDRSQIGELITYVSLL